MPTANIFTWKDGRGWLILSGGGVEGSDPEAQALAKIPAGDPVAYIFAASDIEAGDQHLAALEDAGAPVGYLLDVTTEDDATIRAQLTEAGMILLGDGPNVAALRGGLVGAAAEAMQSAFDEGAVVFGIGAGAAVLGAYFVTVQGDVRPGFGWLANAIILPMGETFPLEGAKIQKLLTEHPECFVIALGDESALAFGPDGQVESWGERRLGVTLGKAYMPNEQEG